MTEIEELKAIVGSDYLAGPQLSEADFRKLLTSANELSNGDYNLGIAQKLTNYILRDQARKIDELEGRIKALEARPSGSVTPAPQPEPTPAPSDTAAIIAALETQGIYVEQNRLGVGIRPIPDSQSALHIGGESGAEITGVSNTKGTDGQNPGEVHISSFVVSDNDGGMRWRQYLIWGKNGKKRNTTNRPASILALDSVGELCSSQQQVDSDVDGGQNWYIKIDWARRLVRFVTFKVGWRPTIEACSTTYGDADEKLL